MREMIKTAVEAALKEVKAAALDQSIKDVLTATIEECSAARSADRLHSTLVLLSPYYITLTPIHMPIFIFSSPTLYI